MNWPLLRGQVVLVNLGLDEPKLLVIVSNNRRNAALPCALGVRLTTSEKPAIPSIVELGHPEVFIGRAVCDDIIEIYEDEVVAIRSGLTAFAMQAIDHGLKAALALD